MALATAAASLVIEAPSDELLSRAYNSYNNIVLKMGSGIVKDFEPRVGLQMPRPRCPAL